MKILWKIQKKKKMLMNPPKKSGFLQIYFRMTKVKVIKRLEMTINNNPKNQHKAKETLKNKLNPKKNFKQKYTLKSNLILKA